MKFLTTSRSWLYRSRRRLATLGVVCLACAIGFKVLFGANGIVIYQQKKAEHRALEREIDSLQKENQRLGERNKALKTDPQAIEKEAREQLRYARPGEVVYSLPAEKPGAAPAASAKK